MLKCESMKRLLFFVIVLAGLILGSCTETDNDGEKYGIIHGIVTVIDSAELMNKMGVELYKNDRILLKTVTFDNGEFVFDKLSPGDYQVKVVSDEYEQIEKGLVTVEAGRIARIDLQVRKLVFKTHIVVRTVEPVVSNNKVTLAGEYTPETGIDYLPSEVGFVYDTRGNPKNDGTVIKCKVDNKTMSFSTTVDNFGKGTYYVQAYAKNRLGTEYGEVRSFNLSGTTIVTTLEPTNISSNSITLNGRIESVGTPAFTEKGFCYNNDGEPTVKDSKVIVAGINSGDYTYSCTGLSPNTTYSVRAYAIQDGQAHYGTTVTFSTKDGLPKVSTSQPSSTATTILIGGSIEDDGGYEIIEKGICYNQAQIEPTISDQKVVGGKGNGTYTITISGLSASTEYHLRAYAINKNGISYGNIVKISTKNGLPVVTTSTSYQSGENYLIVTGSTVTEANAPILRQGICWSINPNPSISNNIVEASVNDNPFSCRIEGLQSGTTYYCRAFAQNTHGLDYGQSRPFTTNYAPTTLKGHVYDQDGNPISGATVMGYDVSGYSGTTDKNGYYSITLGTRMFGNYQFMVSASNYKDKIKDVYITRGKETQLDFNMTLTNLFAVDFGTGLFNNPGTSWEMYFECTQSHLAGTTTTRNMRIKNYRSVPVSWSITNIPSTGISFSKQNGTIPAKGEVSTTVTFTYPSTSSCMVYLSGCDSGTKAYVWNWDATYGGYYIINGTPIQSACKACCWQNPIIMVDDYSEAFTLLFNQGVVYK